MSSMPKDTLTIALTGEVSLDDLDRAIGRFRGLVDALTSEIAAAAGIRWIVAGLEYGSAMATVRGIPSKPEDYREVEAVVQAYGAVGRALERHEPVPFSPRVARSAEQVREIVGKRVQSVRFETADADAVIVAAVLPAERRQIRGAGAPAVGAVEGRIQTVSNRGSLRFTLYDLVDDRAVSCYLREGEEDLLRNLWGRVVVVEGRIKRDPVFGRPASIRDIASVQPRTEPQPGAFRRARGVIPWSPGEPRPEEILRRARDA